MDELTLTLPMVLQHLQVALIPWFIVILMGGGLNYQLSGPLRSWVNHHPRATRFLTLIPWRSATIWAALVVIQSPWFTFSFGLGTFSASISLGIALGLLILPWLVSASLHSSNQASTYEKGFSNPKAIQRESLLNMVRLSAILSIVLVVFLQAGMGYFIWRSSAANDFAKMIQGYEVVGLMMLVVDFIFGVIHLSFSPRSIALNSYRTF